jgi:predicted TIM-barrel fold metal-dependent hydrolase
VETIANRHPAQKIILAHFFFLSADLLRAAVFLDAHPNICFDLTPGSEMFFNFMTGTEASRDFFLRYQDRLIFGTDSGASAVGKPGQTLNREETLGRTFFVRSFLEQDGLLEIPQGVAHWKRPGKQLRGIGLPVDVLKKIYCSNFERLFGSSPAKLLLPKAVEILEAQAEFMDKRAGSPVNSPARQVAMKLIMN